MFSNYFFSSLVTNWVQKIHLSSFLLYFFSRLILFWTSFLFKLKGYSPFRLQLAQLSHFWKVSVKTIGRIINLIRIVFAKLTVFCNSPEFEFNMNKVQIFQNDTSILSSKTDFKTFTSCWEFTWFLLFFSFNLKNKLISSKINNKSPYRPNSRLF